MKRKIIDFLIKNDGKLLIYPFYLYFGLCVMSMISPVADFWDEGHNLFVTIFMSFLYFTVIGAVLGIIPFAQWLYASVNTLSFQVYEFNLLGLASIIIWVMFIAFISILIVLPIFVKKEDEDKEFSIFLSSILIYIVFLFFWRGKGLEDEDYFWLFIFPGIPIYTFTLFKVLKIK